MNLHVCHSKFVIRAKRLNYDSVPPSEHPDLLITKPFEEAFHETWGTDAHFVCHEIVGEEEQFALTKGMLGLLRKSGGEVVMNCFAVDLDRAPHDPWEGQEDLDLALSDLAEALVGHPLLFPTVAYGTLKGLRLVYALNRPIPVDEAEPRLRGLHTLLAPILPQGLEVDKSCTNWDRCYRLPNVNRQGHGRTPDYLLKSLAINPRQTLDPSFLPAIGPKASTVVGGEVQILDIPMPQLDDLPKISGKVKARLKNRECEPFCFSKHKMKHVPPHGQRDPLMHRIVGQIVSLIRNIPDTSPATVFALLHDWAQCIPPEEAEKPPLENLWDKILRIWAQDEAREAAAIERIDDPEVPKTLVEAVRDKWGREAGMPLDQEEAEDWLRSMAIISVAGKSFYILKQDGWYSHFTIPRSGIISEIKKLGMDGFIPLDKVQGKAVVPRSSEDLLNNFSFNADRIIYSSAAPGVYLTKSRGVIMPPCKLRTDLQPKFDKRVDEWLRQFWGQRFADGCNWLAYALDIACGRPIAALALIGAPGAGKKLFVQGIAECFDTYPQSMATSSAFGHFAPELLTASFLNVDEGLPHLLRPGQKHPSEIFRSMVAGDSILVNVKYKAEVILRNPMRIVFTANNHDIINLLCAGRDMTEFDRQALVQRLLYIPALEEASGHLIDMGGRQYTDKWIHSDGGLEDSDYVVARHFLHIHHNFKRRPPGARLLVEGTDASGIMNYLRTGSGTTQTLVPPLLRIIENPSIWKKYEDKGQVLEEDGEIFVSVAAVFEELGTFHKEDLRSVSLGLRALSKGDPVRKRVKASKIWVRNLDLELLEFQAQDIGHAHPRLEELRNRK